MREKERDLKRCGARMAWGAERSWRMKRESRKTETARVEMMEGAAQPVALAEVRA